jgi:DNA-binding transcriptional regulator YdaS (Cro superfamily)
MGHQISMQAVCKWREKDEIPELRCRAVEEIVNGLVTRYELQPEVFGPPPKRPASVRS